MSWFKWLGELALVIAHLFRGRQSRIERESNEEAGAAKSQNKAHEESGEITLDMDRARDRGDHSEEAILADPNRRKPK